MHIMSHAHTRAHTHPPRLVAGYVGPAAGLRTALLTGAALGRPAQPTTALTAGGTR